MTKATPRGARRAPRTAMSESIRDAIVQAACELLVANGLEGMTTNAIAERAGVSVGSVYRYFSDKQAVVTEIARRRRDQNAARLKETITAGGELSEVLRRLIEPFIMLSEEEFELRRVLVEEVPAGWLSRTALDAWSESEAAVAAFLKVHVPTLTDEQAKMRAFIAVHAVDGVARGTAIRSRAADLDAIVRELLAVLEPYLRALPDVHSASAK